MTACRFRLDLPPKALSPNKRVHWAVRAAAVAEYRYACQVDARNFRQKQPHLYPLTPPVQAHITFVFPSKPAAMDEDNCVASFKAGQDGLVDARLFLSDAAADLHCTYAVVVEPGKREVRVVLEGAT